MTIGASEYMAETTTPGFGPDAADSGSEDAIWPRVGRISPDEAALLVEAAAAGSEAAWTRLVDGFLPLLWRTVRQYRLSQADSADVIQTTWLRLVQNLDRLNNPGGVGGYLVVTARREALRLSRLSKQTMPTDNSLVLDRIDLDAAECGDSLIGLERDEIVRALFAELPEKCRTFLALVLADPAPSYREISERLGMPIGSIGPTRARYLNKLAALAAKRGIDLHDLVVAR